MLSDSAPEMNPSPAHTILRTGADINRLIARLLYQWNAPRIEVQLDALPPLHVQHTQQRLEQLHERTIGSWGEIAGGVTLVVGGFHAWTQVRQWQQLGVVMAAVAAVWLTGQLLEAAWRRARLVWAVWRLKRQLRTGRGLYRGSTRPPSLPDYDSAIPTPSVADPVARDAQSPRLRQLPRAGHAETPLDAVLIRQGSDIEPILRRLARQWRLPRIEIRASGLPELDLQRMQHTLTSLAGSCNCVLGALFAAITLLAGGFYIIMTSDEFWEWMGNGELGQGILLTAGVVGAGIAGWMMETLINRLRLAALLSRLRSRLRAEAGEPG